ncbi:MAG: DJ-1/PfpI family protein [Candidatus Pacebacteria bacterium]|nr:DJ-1/PfpI family protein [Candidatus Paceibacterota bacterium]
MKKATIILIVLGILIIFGITIFIWWYQTQRPMQQILKKQALESKPTNLEHKKIAAIIIASEDFRDEEYFRTVEELSKNEIEKKVISTKKGIAKGADGGEVNIDLALEDFKVRDFDAIVFIGGPGALDELDNKRFYRIAKEAVLKKKILAAICISPTILAKAGVLEGKRATVWASTLDRQPIKILEDNGADYINESVVQDGNIITANGPQAAVEFGKKIVRNLKKD